jgi:hypothetical protein
LDKISKTKIFQIILAQWMNEQGDFMKSFWPKFTDKAFQWSSVRRKKFINLCSTRLVKFWEKAALQHARTSNYVVFVGNLSSL